MPNMLVNSRVIVAKQGLKNTGKTGKVIKIDKDRPHIRQVILDDQPDRIYKMRVDSLQELPVKKKLIIPARPRCVLIGTVKQFEVINLRNTAETMRIDGDDVILKTMNGDVKRHIKNVLGIISADDELTFKKPEKDDFPFWIWGEAERKDRYRGYEINEGRKVVLCRQANYNLDWLDLSSCKPRYEDVIEKPKQPIAPPKNELEKAIQLTTDLSNHNHARGLCFGLVYRNKDNEIKVTNRTGAACHYSMKTMRGNLDGEDRGDDYTPLYGVQYITRKHYNNGIDDKLVDKYLKWVMNDSPWSQYIITKKLADGKKHGVYIKADIPSNALMCTFYALRYPTEYPRAIDRWNDWVEAGMNGAGAFFAAETDNFENDQNTPHHGLLDTGKMNLDDLKNFINHGVGRVVAKNYSETWSYQYVSAHHGSIKNGGHGNQTALKQMQELPDLFEVKKAAGPMARDKKVVNKANVVEYINAMKG